MPFGAEGAKKREWGLGSLRLTLNLRVSRGFWLKWAKRLRRNLINHQATAQPFSAAKRPKADWPPKPEVTPDSQRLLGPERAQKWADPRAPRFQGAEGTMCRYRKNSRACGCFWTIFARSAKIRLRSGLTPYGRDFSPEGRKGPKAPFPKRGRRSLVRGQRPQTGVFGPILGPKNTPKKGAAVAWSQKSGFLGPRFPKKPPKISTALASEDFGRRPKSGVFGQKDVRRLTSFRALARKEPNFAREACEAQKCLPQPGGEATWLPALEKRG